MIDKQDTNQTTGLGYLPTSKGLFRTREQRAFYLGWVSGILIGCGLTYLIMVHGV